MAGKTYSAGTIFLSVVPVFGDTMKAIERQAKDANRNVSADLENAIQQGADRGSKKAADKMHRNLVDGSDKAGRDAGDNYSGAFEQRFKRAIDGAEKEMRRLDFKTASDESLRNLDRIKNKLRELKDVDVNVDFDAKKALADIAAVRVAIDSLIDHREINVGFNMREAMRDLQALEARVERFVNERRKVEVDADFKQAERAMGTFEKSFRAHAKRAADSLGDSVNKEVQKIRAELASLGDTDIGIDLSADAAMAKAAELQARLEALTSDNIDIQVVIDAARARAELVTLRAEMNRIDHDTLDVKVDVDAGGAVAELTILQRLMARVNGSSAGGNATGAANSFRAFNFVILAAVTLLPALIPILAAVAGGLLAIGPAAIGAGAGLGVMVLAFSGVGNALQALNAAEKSHGRDALQMEKTVRSAAQGVTDAQRTLARARADSGRQVADAARNVADAEVASARRISDAQRSLVDAHRQAASAIRSALQQQADAERSLASAQRDATQAQKDLSDARLQAQKDLANVGDQLRQNALDIRQAQIDLFNATVENNAAQADPGATNLEREQASINYGNAVERLHELRDAQKDLNKERKAGVEGNQGVQSAEDALASALAARADAARNLVKAEQAVRDARLQGARQVADAERNLAQARSDGAKSVADAERSLNRARSDGARSVADAQRGLTRAQQTYKDALYQTGVLGSTAMQNVHDAMQRLSPAGRRFVRFLWGMRDSFYDIRDAAQESMLPGVTKAITKITGHFGGFEKFVRRMGRAMGSVFVDLADALTGKTMSGFFDMVNRLGPRFTKIFGKTMINFMEAFARLMELAAPTSLKLANALLDISKHAKQFMNSKRGTEMWQKFFAYVEKVGPRVWNLVKDFLDALLNVAVALEPLGSLIMGVVDDLLRFIANMNPKVLGAILTGIIFLVIAFQAMVGTVALLTAGLSLLTTIFAFDFIGIVVLAVGVIVLLVAAFVVAYNSSETFRNIVHKVLHAVGDAAKWFWEKAAKPALTAFWDLVVASWKGIKWAWHNVLYPVIKALWDAIVWVWDKILKPYFTWLWDYWVTVFKGMKWAWNNILWPIIDLFGTMITKLAKKIFGPMVDWIRDHWSDVVDAMKWVWDHVLHPVFNAIGDALVKLKEAFEWAVGKIGDIWGKLQSILAAPVRFVIDTVLNHGLIDAFNWVADKVGSDKMGYIPVPSFAKKSSSPTVSNPGGGRQAPDSALALGGVLPGYTPGRDVHHFRSATAGNLHLSGGEAIMVPEFTAAVGADRINYWNKLFRRKGRRAANEAFEGGSFASGGIFGGGAFSKGGIFSNPSGRTTVDGKAISRIAAAQLALAEKLAHVNFYIMQGGFGGSHIAASGTSHNYPGVMDIGPASIAYERVMRQVGFAAWARNIAGRSQVGSGAHIHAVSLLDPADRGSPQVYGSWANHGNGLSGYNNDPAPHYSWIPGLQEKLGAVNLSGISGGAGGGGFQLPGWISKLAHPLEWLIDRLPLDKLDQFGRVGDLLVDGVKFVAGEVADKIGDMVHGFTSSFGGAIKAGVGAVKGFLGIGGGKTQDIVQQVAAKYGWGSGAEWAALQQIVSHESGWNPNAQNPTSTAYGLFQFLDGTWAGTGIGKTSDPVKQSIAGMIYIRNRYHDPVGAWNWWQANGSYEEGGVLPGNVADNGTMMYDNGGYLPPGITQVVNLTGKPEPVFTSSQFDSLQRGGGNGGTTVDIDVHGSNLTAGDVADEFLWAIRNVENGGVYSGLVGDR